MPPSFLAIVNEAAGHGRCKRLAKGALDRLREQGLTIDVQATRAPGHATAIAQSALRRGVRHFIAVGGDGTTFEVLNGLSEQLATPDPSARVSLGFLPLGTGNSFLRDFGAADAEHATTALLSGRTRSCDVARLTHASGTLDYLNLLSFGFVADVCTVTNARFKRLGQAGYAFGVVATLAQLHSRPVQMRLDGGALWEQDVTFVSLNNSRYTGGNMMMAPYADPSDGALDVIVCGKLSRVALLELFPTIFRGHHVHDPALTAARARVVEILSPEAIDLMIDGEVLRHAPQRVEVLPNALDIFV